MRTELDGSRTPGRPPSRFRSERGEAVIAMTRLAAGPDPVPAILDRLARRSATAALIGVDGTLLTVCPGRNPLDRSVLADTARAVPELHGRGTPAAVRGGAGTPTVHLVSLGDGASDDGAAHRQLRIHRNTLAARLAVLRHRLDLDLSRVSDQSVAWLALHLLGPAATPDAEARLPDTAAALGVSVSAVRKRLGRAEQALGRSLLRGPSARHELWLAVRILDAAPGGGSVDGFAGRSGV